MTTDPRARAAVEDLWAHTVADPQAGLATLFVTRSRRRQHVGVGMAVAAVVAAVALVATWWTGTDPIPTPAPPPPWAQQPRTDPCQAEFVTCLGARTYRFDLAAPVLWHIPPGFGVNSGSGAGELSVESYWTHHGNNAGVSVLEHVRAASQRTATSPARGVPATAAGFISWLASRPYFVATAPRHVTVAGHPAWHVRVSMRPGSSPGPAHCLQGSTPCRAVTSSPGVSGVWGDMVADYTAFDLPGRGTTVVWSWAFGHDEQALARNGRLVDGLSWPSS